MSRLNSYTIGSIWTLKRDEDYVLQSVLLGKKFELKCCQQGVGLVRLGCKAPWNDWVVVSNLSHISNSEWDEISANATFWKDFSLSSSRVKQAVFSSKIKVEINKVEINKVEINNCDCSARDLLHIGHKCKAKRELAF